MWLQCCLSGSCIVTPRPLPFFLHLHRHRNSSHRGEQVHRKLGVWQDKTHCWSDTVSWQPLRAADDDQKKGVIGGRVPSELLIDCRNLKTNRATNILAILIYIYVTLSIHLLLPAGECVAAESMFHYQSLKHWQEDVTAGLSHIALYRFSHQCVLIKSYYSSCPGHVCETHKNFSCYL